MKGERILTHAPLILNKQQKAAIQYIGGPLLVLAGAGSGKTRVITQKIVHLIDDLNVSAKQICAVTFTNKAAQEMGHRLNLVLSHAKKKGLTVGTFHNLGLRFIKREYAKMGLPKKFSMMDDEDARQLLRGVLPKAKSQDRETVSTLLGQISLWKNSLLPIERWLEKHPEHIENQDYFTQYQAMLRACQGVDFDDLIVRPLQLMQENHEVRQIWQQRWRYILVDEYQDTNPAQYEFIKCLLGPYTQLTVVGDDDQSIYAWRGANPNNLKQLSQDFKNLEVIKLEQNYRSAGRILQAANALIANNEHVYSKQLWSELGPGDLLRVIQTSDDLQEAEQVVMDMISHKYQFGQEWSDYAILYRGNHQSRHFERLLRLQHVPYQISGGQSWFGRSEIKDMIAYLKLCSNFEDDSAFLRIINTPKRGVGEQTLKMLTEYAKSRGLPLLICADHLALSQNLQPQIRQTLMEFKQWIVQWSEQFDKENWSEYLYPFFASIGFEAYWYDEENNPVQAQKKMERVQELLDWMKRLHEKKPAASLADICHQLMLIDLLSKEENQEEGRVQLMTLHAAKGLEFPYVYLIGMEEGLLPHQHSMEEEHLPEERRLAYVGITRAQKGLVFSCAQKRKRGGEWVVSTPSRFLHELPEELLIWHQSDVSDPSFSKQLAKKHLSDLKSLLS